MCCRCKVTGVDWCIEASRAGNIEVWTAPLSGGRFGVVLFNRSGGTQPVTLNWSDLPASAATKFAVKDVWLGQQMGVFQGSYLAPSVPAFGVTFLVLTP